jgi:hypothetical protein
MYIFEENYFDIANSYRVELGGMIFAFEMLFDDFKHVNMF